MRSHEWAIVEFALIWQPYGGPTPEDILVEFGMTEPVFRARIRAVLSARGTTAEEPFLRHARSALWPYLRAAGVAR
ncbi:hypothetical protein [Nocardia sp. NPDC004860]|uniref:hypothetical protein n=1 Tax=unclassified Nocardia TaxID=2637762 RepID=UPI0033AFC1AB